MCIDPGILTPNKNKDQFPFNTYTDARYPWIDDEYYAFAKDWMNWKYNNVTFDLVYDFSKGFFENIEDTYQEAKKDGVELLEIREQFLFLMYQMCDLIETEIEITDAETNSLNPNKIRRQTIKKIVICT